MSADAYGETLAFLAQTPQRVAELLGRLDGSAVRTRPAADGFSAVEQACHLRDVELEGYVVRARRILAEDNPELAGIDGGKLAAERDYQSQDLKEALTAFAVARSASLDTLRNATAAERMRRGRFEEGAEITLEKLAGMMRAHDTEHLAEIEELARRFAAGH